MSNLETLSGLARVAGSRGVRRMLVAVSLTALALWCIERWLLRSEGWAVQLAGVSARAEALAPWHWALVFAGLAASVVFRVQRVHAEWSPRVGVRWIECLRVVAMHNALVLLLPLRSGEAGFAWLLWRRWQVPVASAAFSLLWWRVQDAMILLVFAAALLWPAPPAARTAAALLMSGLAWLACRRRVGLARTIRRCAASTRWTRTLAYVADAIEQPRGGATAWVCGTAKWSVKLLTVSVALCGLAQVHTGAALAGAVAGEIGSALPLQPLGGFGTYEAGVLAGVSLQQAGASNVLAAALLIHLLMLAFSAALGAVCWLSARGTKPTTGAFVRAGLAR
jgi:uncharacterized membrane protein YbhN (UPF0104 family)